MRSDVPIDEGICCARARSLPTGAMCQRKTGFPNFAPVPRFDSKGPQRVEGGSCRANSDRLRWGTPDLPASPGNARYPPLCCRSGPHASLVPGRAVTSSTNWKETIDPHVSRSANASLKACASQAWRRNERGCMPPSPRQFPSASPAKRVSLNRSAPRRPAPNSRH